MVFILVFALFGLGFPNGFADLSDALLAVIGIICGYWSERATYFGLNPYIGITYVVNVLIFGSILVINIQFISLKID